MVNEDTVIEICEHKTSQYTVLREIITNLAKLYQKTQPKSSKTTMWNCSISTVTRRIVAILLIEHLHREVGHHSSPHPRRFSLDGRSLHPARIHYNNTKYMLQ
jgi:hypothetical protein